MLFRVFPSSADDNLAHEAYGRGNFFWDDGISVGKALQLELGQDTCQITIKWKYRKW